MFLSNNPSSGDINSSNLSCFIWPKYRDANHSDFCGIIPVFKADFRIMILDIKILTNNDFDMVPDK